MEEKTVTDCLLENNPMSVIFNSLCVEVEGTCHTELDGLRPTMGKLNSKYSLRVCISTAATS